MINSQEDGLFLVYLVFYFIFVCIHFIAEPARWVIYSPSVQKGRFILFIKIISFTAFVGYVLPMKMGLPLRILLLRTKANLSVHEISALLLFDGLIYYALWGLSALSMLILLSITPLKFEYKFNPYMLLAIFIAVFTALSITFFIKKIKEKNNEKDKIKSITSHIKDFFKKILIVFNGLRTKVLMTVVLINSVDIVSHILRHWALVTIFGYELTLLNLSIITCLSIFAGLMSMMPMGLGGYDIVIVLLLVQMGIPFESAINIPVMNRVGTIAVSALFGIWSWLGLNINTYEELKKLNKFFKK